ncbi:MAG: HEAT repeat domain-containing protein [Pirellulales bacterium]|nr:HEAT repeat domain-containing protein [Pirellulales bacterium]
MQRFVTRRGSWLACVGLLVATSAAEVQGQDLRGPFQHAPRSVRSRTVDLDHLRLELDFDFVEERLQGLATNRFTPFEPLDQVEFDIKNLTIDRIELVPSGASADLSDRRTLQFEVHDERLVVKLDRVYQPSEQVSVAIAYRVTRPERGMQFVTPDKHEPQQPRMVWTLNEPEDARYWLPTFDSPNERLTSELIATVPEDFFVLSNGVLRERGEPRDGRRRWHWVQQRSHVPYLISIVAGQFEALDQTWRGIPVVSYVPTGRLADAPRSFAQTPEMMELFSEKIGYPYPWPKYTQICCDEFNGGMEHTSCTTLALDTLHDERAELDVSSEELVAHELAHQWWGDLLTCKDWAELWLNESFATYFATLWQEHDEGWDAASWSRREEADVYFREDADRYRRPIVTYRYDAPIVMFDAHSYPKGGRVLHMLRFELGDDAFWKALRHYAHTHEYQVVETADLRTAIEQATGRGLNWFLDQWVDHGGHPELTVGWDWDEATRQVRLHVRQTQKVDALTPLFRATVEVELATGSETLIRRIEIDQAEETFHFELPTRPRRVVFDPRDWLLKKLTVEQSLDAWLDQLAADPHVIPRADAAKALAQFSGNDTVREALVKAATSDAFWGVRYEAIAALAKIGGDAVRAPLIQVARGDARSAVRREALKSLAEFPHEETSAALRAAIAEDPSYFAVAAALRSLAKVDKEKAKDDLLAALERPSYQEVILQAAAEGLVEQDARGTAARMMALLKPPSSPHRRMVLMPLLARLDPGNPEVTAAIAEQLNDGRRTVRTAAIRALGMTGDKQAIDLLLARKQKEAWLAPRRAIDDAVAQLRNPGLPRVIEQVEALRAGNAELRARLEKLEAAGAK